MFSRSLLFPIGIGSAALAAYKRTSYRNAFKKSYLAASLSTLLFSQL